ncbi:heavy metal-associated isoprenylated plant protein 28-like [Asparagus officinalis]|uniref:heavy metal-associated isoprenylated plant protein 28-like n=1 Tax=Asparagus officinalis TaxID=4686 RepID=UPI00098E2055|nr:heavy metal-associated isoprenylated plant protein 28-like [Asparagus officinalis]
MTIVEMCVHMDCPGCEKEIRKALQKVKGIDEVHINMVTQKVTVTGGWLDQKKVLKAVRKTGRTAVFWPYPYNREYNQEYNQEYNRYNTQHYYNQYHASHSQNHYVPYGAYPYSYASMSSYNYRKGYDDSYMHGYYQRAPVDERAGAMFSDDNPNACSIM